MFIEYIYMNDNHHQNSHQLNFFYFKEGIYVPSEKKMAQ